MQPLPCPFKVGEMVIYRPEIKNRELVLNSRWEDLVPGARYKIAAIVQEMYIVPQGFEDAPGGGLIWTDFSRE